MAPEPEGRHALCDLSSAHGALTRGLLDALLADPRVEFEGFSGSSAHDMNAVVLANGWVDGGREGAHRALDDFSTAVGKQMPMGMVPQGDGDAIALSPVNKTLATWAAHFSPSRLNNPFDLIPLRDRIARQVGFERLRSSCHFKLFVGATQVNTGKLRVLRAHELTLDMLLALAGLPKIHHAVDIDGVRRRSKADVKKCFA